MSKSSTKLREVNYSPSVCKGNLGSRETEVTIFVFANGDKHNCNSAKRFDLCKFDLLAWNPTLDTIATKMGLRRKGIKSLYTVRGKRINSYWELSNGGCYVGVSPHESFRKLPYFDPMCLLFKREVFGNDLFRKENRYRGSFGSVTNVKGTSRKPNPRTCSSMIFTTTVGGGHRLKSFRTSTSSIPYYSKTAAGQKDTCRKQGSNKPSNTSTSIKDTRKKIENISKYLYDTQFLTKNTQRNNQMEINSSKQNSKESSEEKFSQTMIRNERTILTDKSLSKNPEWQSIPSPQKQQTLIPFVYKVTAQTSLLTCDVQQEQEMFFTPRKSSNTLSYSLRLEHSKDWSHNVENVRNVASPEIRSSTSEVCSLESFSQDEEFITSGSDFYESSYEMDDSSDSHPDVRPPSTPDRPLTCRTECPEETLDTMVDYYFSSDEEYKEEDLDNFEEEEGLKMKFIRLD